MPEQDKIKENMKLWNQVCFTDPSKTKKVENGKMNLTSVRPQSQRKRATEIFGPYGIGWGIVPESEKFEFKSFEDVTLALYFGVLFYILEEKRGEIPINACIKASYQTSKGYVMVDDEYTKKVQTNALTKGLSTLGFNSDIFEGWFDDCKYVQSMNNYFHPPQKPLDLPPDVTVINAHSGTTVTGEQINNGYNFDPKTKEKK